MQEFKLSKQEQRVLILAISGLNDPEVADALGVSIETVRTYWKRLKRKIGSDSRNETIARAVRSNAQVEITAEQLQKEQLRREVAQRRQMEALYRSILDTLGEALLVAAEDGHCVEANSAACRLLGRRRDELLKAPVQGLVHESSHAEFEAIWTALKKSKAWEGRLVLAGESARLSWARRAKGGSHYLFALHPAD